MAKVGVILSGCGVYDGSEISEAVLTLLSLSQRESTARCIAPKKDFEAINHVTQKPEGGSRCTLAESARIARGEIDDLATVNVADYDAFILPGGFGAVKNLCDFAAKGADCAVDPQLVKVLRDAHAAGKPLGFACIAPAIAAKVFGEEGVKLTIGHDEATAAKLTDLGAKHVACEVKEIVVDDARRIASTPAYMEAKSLAELHLGIDKLVAQVLEWASEPAYA